MTRIFRFTIVILMGACAWPRVTAQEALPAAAPPPAGTAPASESANGASVTPPAPATPRGRRNAGPPPMVVDQNNPPPPFTSPAEVYSGISGPGKPVEGDGGGGYRSGREGLMYSGAAPAKPGWLPLAGGNAPSGSVVKEGLLPPLRPIWDLHLRDTIIRKGGDEYYYMTGSTGDNIWDRNDGIELYRSKDLQKWDYLGLVWSVEKDGVWQKNTWGQNQTRINRDLWAPEIVYIKGNYYLPYCMQRGGTGVLKSSTGKPEGPYVSINRPDARLTGGIDATLFEDDDGSVYFTNGGGGTIYKMKPDLSGFDGPGKTVEIRGSQSGAGRVSLEGASIFKHNGRYYLTGASFFNAPGGGTRYSSVAAIADNIWGPYTDWHEAVPCGGGGNYFLGPDGFWYCTFFGNDGQAPWREKPGLLRVDFAPDGKIVVAKKQPDFVLVESARNGKSSWSDGPMKTAAAAPASPVAKGTPSP